MLKSESNSHESSILFVYIAFIFIALAATYRVVVDQVSGIEFLDLGVFFLKQQQPQLLINDWYTNTVFHGNPKQIFGYIILFLSELTQLPWYKIYYALSWLALVGEAFLFYLISCYVGKAVLLTGKDALVCVISLGFTLLLLLLKPFYLLFSIAWWPPYLYYASPQSLAFFLGLVSSYLFMRDKRPFVILAAILQLVATCIHPSLGIFVLAFQVLVLIVLGRYKELSLSIASTFSGVLIILLLYPQTQTLTTKEFIDIYVLFRHPHHYHVPELKNFAPYSWIINFIFVCSIFVIGIISGVLKRNKPLILLSALFLISYSGAVVGQYVFIDIIPLKLIAALGPIRYTTLAGLESIIILTIIVAMFFPRISWFNQFREEIQRKLPTKKIIGALLLITIASCVLYLRKQYRDPIEQLTSRAKDTYSWIRSNTQASDVFALPPGSNILDSFSYISGRPLLAQEHFPFNEKFFLEFRQRLVDLYGTSKANRKTKYYQKSGDQIKSLKNKYKLRYLVAEKGITPSWPGTRLVFQGDKYSIYAITDQK